jgi:hypothetical protein
VVKTNHKQIMETIFLDNEKHECLDSNTETISVAELAAILKHTDSSLCLQ